MADYSKLIDIDPQDGRLWQACSSAKAAEVTEMLAYSGAYLPDITKILFSHGKKKTSDGQERDVLVTIIYFADGTKVQVQNSDKDLLRLNPDGTVSREAKEIGIAYAILKRLTCGQFSKDEDGQDVFTTSGFCTALNDLVNMAVDTNAVRKAKAAAKAAAKKAPTPPKAKRPSLAQTVRDLSKTVQDLSALVQQKLA